MPAKVLHAFRSLRVAKLLYRARLRPGETDALVEVLAAARGTLARVEMRLHGPAGDDLAFLARVPWLGRVSLFGGGRDVGVLGKCAYLSEVGLEWVGGVSGEDLKRIARGLGGRLRKLRVWHCAGVDDDGLRAVAELCPFVEVELRFVREQFSGQVLALFGDRVSWRSYLL